MASYNYHTSKTGNYSLLLENAKENRRFMTPAESALWNMIKAKNLGVRFRRQHPIGDYIVDFVCLSHNLVIEVDGGYHNEYNVQLSDVERTNYLSNEGYKVIRFTNEEVLLSPEDCLRKIIEELGIENTSNEEDIIIFG